MSFANVTSTHKNAFVTKFSAKVSIFFRNRKLDFAKNDILGKKCFSRNLFEGKKPHLEA